MTDEKEKNKGLTIDSKKGLKINFNFLKKNQKNENKYSDFTDNEKTMNIKKILAVSVIFMMVVVAIFTGYSHYKDDESDVVIVTPVDEKDYKIEPNSAFSEQPSSSMSINIPADNYEATTVTSSLFKNDVETYIDYVPTTGAVDATFTDLGLFSAQVALQQTEDKDYNTAIIVENYSNALLMVPLASLLDAPIIYDGEYANEALWRLGTIKGTQIICSGNTNFNKKGVTYFDNDDFNKLVLEVVEFTIKKANELGTSYDYITIANPWDYEGNADIPGLSAFSAPISVFRNALILPCISNNTSIDNQIKATKSIMENNSMELRFLLMMGDPQALPFNYNSYARYGANSDQNPVASDNLYANFDDNPYTIEIATGRLLAKTLSDMSNYLHRDIHYNDYLNADSAPSVNLPTIRHTEGEFLDGWNNNAVVYCAAGAWFDPKAEHYCWREFYEKAGFNTQDDTPESHTQYSGFVNDQTSILAHDFAMSNFVAIDADHGNKYSTVTFNSEDLKDMPPNVIFGVSCMLGWTDNVDIDRSMTYTMLEKGCHAFLAATRTTFGVISTDTVTDYPTEENDKAGNGLCRLFFEDLIENDHTVGEAMMDAKNDLMNTDKWNSIFNDEEWEINEIVCWEYMCYGDPAFNPYEPCNEGS